MLITILKSKTFWASFFGTVLTVAAFYEKQYAVAGVVVVLSQALVANFHLNPSQITQDYTDSSIGD